MGSGFPLFRKVPFSIKTSLVIISRYISYAHAFHDKERKLRILIDKSCIITRDFVFFRSDKVTLQDRYVFDDGDESTKMDTFQREPFIVRFKAQNTSCKLDIFVLSYVYFHLCS